jgi:tRNA A37 threonylcarbamoyladenosine synthetase subunit TsaC/SUA5/YrdC
VVSFEEDDLVIVRQGPISEEELRAVLA